MCAFVLLNSTPDDGISWSASGGLLASGSDDKLINIHQFNPLDLDSQFALSTTIDTGHTFNIFSVQFMPHSGDKTIVSCAGDEQVRVFDLEYSRQTYSGGHYTPSQRHSQYNRVTSGRSSSPQDTNCKVYRSHNGSVKKIVTESSPYLFLTCSQDGDVRQWDLRQTSSFYPSLDNDPSSLPPPLISYSKYGLDLNTISCSPSQPHYIALGGNALHCFLHDRRMLGRDRNHEKGQAVSTSTLIQDEETIGEATRCVRKFKSATRPNVGGHRSSHITACKISDANPNEMIVSWSGDRIYSFDLVNSVSSTDDSIYTGLITMHSENTYRSLTESRKRKLSSSSQNSLGRIERSIRHIANSTSPTTDDQESMFLRIQYGNGQCEEILLGQPAAINTESDEVVSPPNTMLSKLMRDITKLKMQFLYRRCYREAYQLCRDLLPNLLELQRYETRKSTTLRDSEDDRFETQADRDAIIRFVQASGVLCRLLKAPLKYLTSMSCPFAKVAVYHWECSTESSEATCRYDFVRAICSWLDSGVGALLHFFSKSVAPSIAQRFRFPLVPDADERDIEQTLIPHLLRDITDEPLPTIRMDPERVPNRQCIHLSEKNAILEFLDATRTPFADLTATDVYIDDIGPERDVAIEFWAGGVARGILKREGRKIDSDMINRAFGSATAHMEESGLSKGIASKDVSEETGAEGDLNTNVIANRDHAEHYGSEDEEDDDDDGGDDDNDDDYNDDYNEYYDDDDDHDYDDDALSVSGYWSTTGLRKRNLRNTANINVVCAEHTRVYSGHRNVATVKDVNYYGLNDEYVVSGSDDGNFFIWDRKTTKLLNILKGDQEVVNIIQGHPHEPMLAVSGIDHSIKIFSADSIAIRDARYGRWQDCEGLHETHGPWEGMNGDCVPPGCLSSRREMHHLNEITAKNDCDRYEADTLMPVC